MQKLFQHFIYFLHQLVKFSFRITISCFIIFSLISSLSMEILVLIKIRSCREPNLNCRIADKSKCRNVLAKNPERQSKYSKCLDILWTVHVISRSCLNSCTVCCSQHTFNIFRCWKPHLDCFQQFLDTFEVYYCRNDSKTLCWLSFSEPSFKTIFLQMNLIHIHNVLLGMQQ